MNTLLFNRWGLTQGLQGKNPYLLTFIIRTAMMWWYVVWWDSKNGYHKDMSLKKIKNLECVLKTQPTFLNEVECAWEAYDQSLHRLLQGCPLKLKHPWFIQWSFPGSSGVSLYFPTLLNDVIYVCWKHGRGISEIDCLQGRMILSGWVVASRIVIVQMGTNRQTAGFKCCVGGVHNGVTESMKEMDFQRSLAAAARCGQDARLDRPGADLG